MTAPAMPIVRQYPCVLLNNQYCPLFRETVVSLSICLSPDHSTIIDMAAIPSDGLKVSPVFRLSAITHAEKLGVSLYIEEVV
ncbi:hypothetical protein [Neisseria shayeganii]|uniref:Uncharacterized protein n=1 Tax=Neisseria shayeganii TaxID=607712 RepID=A0A7D7NC70_9NEIS|nr:hypothetical protein [Neisseria shayeganii]QMT40876.1 hypothetical protein H3L94_02120 [Neisseria shayeganii]